MPARPQFVAVTLLLLASLAAAQSDRGRRDDLRGERFGPDSEVHPGVPRGRLVGPTPLRSQVFPGTTRRYWVHVPAQYDPARPACVLVWQDGARAIDSKGELRVPIVLDNLMAKGEIPATVGIFVTPGQLGDEFPEKAMHGGNPNHRSVEYDSLGDAYARFVINELLPEVGNSYNLTKTPEGRAIGGSSSGAFAAFNVAWERPDQFRRVVSLIGSYTDIRGGHVLPRLVVEAPSKPIRVFLQDGVKDLPNPNPRKDWHKQNKLMVAALQQKGYDLQYVFGEGGHSDRHGGAILPEILRWLWRDYPR